MLLRRGSAKVKCWLERKKVRNFTEGFSFTASATLNPIHYTILGLDFGIMYRFAGNRSQIYIVSYINIMQVG